MDTKKLQWSAGGPRGPPARSCIPTGSRGRGVRAAIELHLPLVLPARPAYRRANMSSKPVRRPALLSAVLLGTLVQTFSACANDLLPPGFRPLPPGVHALVGGKLVPKPGETLDGATIVIRDGYIEAVGKDATVPADARVWDVKGLTIYAGFIEPYLALGATNSPVSTSDSEPINSATLAAGGVNFFGAPGQRTVEH